MGELGKGHESYALIGILLEDGDFLARAPSASLAGHQFTKVGNPVPGNDTVLDRFEQVCLLVDDRLLLERRNDAIRARNDGVIELAPGARHRALQENALVAG